VDHRILIKCINSSLVWHCLVTFHRCVVSLFWNVTKQYQTCVWTRVEHVSEHSQTCELQSGGHRLDFESSRLQSCLDTGWEHRLNLCADTGLFRRKFFAVLAYEPSESLSVYFTTPLCWKLLQHFKVQPKTSPKKTLRSKSSEATLHHWCRLESD